MHDLKHRPNMPYSTLACCQKTQHIRRECSLIPVSVSPGSIYAHSEST